MYQFIFMCLCFVLVPFLANAKIIETLKFEELLAHADSETLVLIDMDDTLTDSTLTLGSSSWRHFLRKHFKGQKHPVVQIDTHDYYAYLAAKHVPVKTVEETTLKVVQTLQGKKIPTLCLTGRGKNRWYSSSIDHIDDLTKKQLLSVNIDFRQSSVPVNLNEQDIPFYSDGILFSAGKRKGELLKELFTQLNYSPKKVVMIDDKEEELRSIEQALQEMGIPFLGLWYRYIEKNQQFNPQIANIQLEKMLQQQHLLSDEEASQFSSSVDPETHLQQIIQSHQASLLR
jgi:FMN phosphatase YigB (HAD superfamily)